MALRNKSYTIFLGMLLTLFIFWSNATNSAIDFGSSQHRHRIEEITLGGDDGQDGHFESYPSYFDVLEEGKFSGFMTLERVKTKSDSGKKLSVVSFGAKGDGAHDDTQAFEKAWATACASKTGTVILVPQGKNYLLKPIKFSGPCKSDITFQISGTIRASADISDYEDRHWLLFDKVTNLIVQGGGTINGNGHIWWQNSCKVNKKLPCKGAPTALTFYDSKNIIVKNLNVKDAQQIQVSFENCVNVQASYLTVTAPGDSPNTDGIHVTNTQNIHISNCVIGTGDDCISIVSGSKNVQATDITCGPGHGISIGSLGKNSAQDYVSHVIVNRAKLTGTTNGVRIKTWQGGSGMASNMTFQNIEMDNVYNPIIIDQNYCDQKEPCKTQKKAVQITNVVYKGIRGTSASDVAIKFDCSQTYPCKGVVLQNIQLQGEQEKAKASCSNIIHLFDIGQVTPQC